MGKYEVTNAQYKKFRPNHSDSDDKLPVTDVRLDRTPCASPNGFRKNQE